MSTPELYGSELAKLHHAHFGSLAREAAQEVLEGLREQALGAGAVVELACGGGISSRILAEAGYEVVGVDISEAMLELARQHVPGARFERGSLWDFELPACVAVTAVGEALCYQTPGQRPNAALFGARTRSIAAALPVGGLFVFDVATPGRSGPSGRRLGVWEVEGASIRLDEREDTDAKALTRFIDSYLALGDVQHTTREIHRLSLYEPNEVERVLAGAGFSYVARSRFGAFEFLPGWVGYVAVKQ